MDCTVCGRETEVSLLREAREYALWTGGEACPACVQNALLTALLEKGEAAFHRGVQAAWPLDAKTALGPLPIPLRLHADARYTGRGVTIALIDSGFYPHLDLVEPRNRILACVDATVDNLRVLRFQPDEQPRWPGWDEALDRQWHGTMTSVVAAGNGHLSRGLYRGLASEANLVLIRARDDEGRITNPTIVRALEWVRANTAAFGIRVVNLSLSGDPVQPLRGNPIDAAVERLVESGVVVTAAAGNDGARMLLPPATSPRAITVGGIDDHGLLDDAARELWHSNYGRSAGGFPKPELVAPSIWVAAPLLPTSAAAREARGLFGRRAAGDSSVDEEIAARRLITPHYQHADGTSFAAPIAAGAVACVLEANPGLTPPLVREILLATAQPVAGAPRERQGAGVLAVGPAVVRAIAEAHPAEPFRSPLVSPQGIAFTIHDDGAASLEVRGSWDGWRAPGIAAERTPAGFWRTSPARLAPGRHFYKFVVDSQRWVDDPANPEKAHDGWGAWNSVLEV